MPYYARNSFLVFPFGSVFTVLGSVSEHGGLRASDENSPFHKSNENALFFPPELWKLTKDLQQSGSICSRKMVNLSKDSEFYGILNCLIPILLSPN